MGLIKNYYLNGNIYLQEFRQNGKLEGERKVWYENGQISALEFYRKGKIEGERKTWYSNGCIMRHEFYRSGKLIGKCRNWSRDAEEMSISFYKNDKMNGEFRFLSQHACPHNKYYWNGMLVDKNFTRQKKITWLRLRKIFDGSVHDKHTDMLSLFIISDLLNLA